MKHVQTFESFVNEASYVPQGKPDYSKLSTAAAAVAKLTEEFEVGAPPPQNTGVGKISPDEMIWNGKGFSPWKEQEPIIKKADAEVLKKYNEGLKELGAEPENIVFSQGQDGYIGQAKAKKVFDLAKKMDLKYFTFDVPRGGAIMTYIMFPAK